MLSPECEYFSVWCGAYALTVTMRWQDDKQLGILHCSEGTSLVTNTIRHYMFTYNNIIRAKDRDRYLKSRCFGWGVDAWGVVLFLMSFKGEQGALTWCRGWAAVLRVPSKCFLSLSTSAWRDSMASLRTKKTKQYAKMSWWMWIWFIADIKCRCQARFKERCNTDVLTSHGILCACFVHHTR